MYIYIYIYIRIHIYTYMYIHIAHVLCSRMIDILFSPLSPSKVLELSHVLEPQI